MTREELKIFKKIPTLKTERLTLRKINRSDIDDVYEYASDPAVSEFLLWYPHTAKSYTRAYLNEIDKRYKKAEFYDWGIVVDGKLIGTVGFTSFNIEENSAEIGYVISRLYWGLGITKEAAEKIIEFGFRELALDKISARYIMGNEKSASIMKKCGMTKDDSKKEEMLVKGKIKTILKYTIRKEEYFK